MTINRRAVICGGLSLAAGSLQAMPARAQADWPRQPLRILIGFPAGGVPDIASRLMQPGMQTLLGQPVLVENRPGASGTTAAEAVARAAPDGHTLFMTTGSTQSIAPALFPSLRYEPERDFAPVSLIARVPHVLLVPPSLGVSSLAELLALLRREPGRHNFASSGVGAIPHLAAEMFRMQSGVDIIHVPYRGSTPALNDLVAGRVSLLFDALPPAIGLVDSGQLRVIAAGTRSRIALKPDIPTLAESGMPEFESYTWAGLYATGGTPSPIVDRLNAAAVQVLREPLVSRRMAEIGYEVVGSGPRELAMLQAAEHEKWGTVIRRAGIKVEN
jgi:tripartite-type tricarboxylate transporter receptor subunit TctC